MIRERLLAAQEPLRSEPASEAARAIVRDLLCALTHRGFGAAHPQLVSSIIAMLKRDGIDEATSMAVVAIDQYRAEHRSRPDGNGNGGGNGGGVTLR